MLDATLIEAEQAYLRVDRKYRRVNQAWTTDAENLAFEAEVNALLNERDPIAELILATPAESIVGLAIKLRIMRAHDEVWEHSDDIACAILTDAERLAEAAVSASAAPPVER